MTIKDIDTQEELKFTHDQWLSRIQGDFDVAREFPVATAASMCWVWIRIDNHYSELNGSKNDNNQVIIPPATKLGGGVYWNHPVRPSVRPSVCPSVCRRAVR